MKILARVLEVCFILVFYVIALVVIQLLEPMTTTTAVLFGMLYGMFMIATLNTIFNFLPKSISKYYLNNH